MSETLGVWPPTIDEYQHFVESTRRADAPDQPWTNAYADYVDGEHLELVAQHGPVMEFLLFPEAFEPHEKTSLQHWMADELSDLLWFATDIADRYGFDIGSATATALTNHARQPIAPITHFADLQKQVMIHANQVVISNKWTSVTGDLTPLVINPQYVLVRTLMRLSRSLRGEGYDMMPPSATELEPVINIEQAVGEFVTAAYIAKDRLDTDIETIAHFNQAKLEHRLRYGKENDLAFGTWLGLR